MKGWRIGAVVALALALSVLAATPALADTVGPAITNRSPANDALVDGAFTVKAHLSDADTVDPTVTVAVDGVSYPVTFTYGGHWEGDGCDSWWVEDKTIADISCDIPDLVAGPHTVTITARDALANVSVDTFSVTRISDLTYSGHTPAPSSRNKTCSLVEVTVSGPSIDTSSVIMTMDGVPVAAEYVASSDPTIGLVRHEGVIADGTHSFTVSAADTSGNPAASTQWSFLVDSTIEGPVASSISPADGSIVQGAFTVSLRATDSDGVNGGASRLGVAGHLLSPSSVDYPYGHWEDDGCNAWWVTDYTRCDITFSVPDLLPGPHAMDLTLVDDLTDRSLTQWSVTRSSDLTIESLQPAQDARVGVSPTVSAVVTGNAEVATSTVTMTIDGVSVPAVWDSASSTVRYDSMLAEGLHSVTVSAGDIYGNAPASRTWSFVSDVSAPVISSYEPMGTCTDALSGVRVVMSDVDGISPSSVTLQLDGAVYAMSTSAAGTTTTAIWSGTFTEGSHEATFSASDLAGNTVVHAWSFLVADPPRFGVPTPPAGSLTPPSQTFTVPVWDVNMDLDVTSPQAWLDGSPVSASLALSDARNGTVSVPLSGLTEGSHTLLVSVADLAGNAGTTSIPFVTDATPPAVDLASRNPAAGATAGNHNVQVSAWFYDASVHIDAATARIWVDGQPVVASTQYGGHWEGDDCTGYWVEERDKLRIYATVPLHDGSHTVRMQVADVYGNLQDHSWSFQVLEKPTISALSPAPGSETNVTSIGVSAKATDYDGIDPASVSVRWRMANIPGTAGAWQSLATTFDAASGTIAAPFGAPYTETRYEFEIAAADVGGTVTIATTNVYVGTAKATLAASQDCESCHPGSTTTAHPHMDDCALCHGDPEGPCAGSGCHGYPYPHDASLMTGQEFYAHGGYYTGRSCADCHDHNLKKETMRHWSSAPVECEPCHARALTTEHEGRLDSAGSTFTCLTCHRSTDTVVTDAITAKNTECKACHGTAASHVGVHDGTFRIQFCSGCHDPNLFYEHVMKRAMDCDVCHEGGFPLSAAAAVAEAEAAGLGPSAPIDMSTFTSPKNQEGHTQPGVESAATVVFGAGTDCEVCHTEPHGPRTDCATCHGVEVTTDGSEPTATVPGYASWEATGANAAVDTPHKGYTTATNKCAVCHSVHKAPAAGELLTRGAVSGSCVYCHVQTTLGVVVVYGGDIDAYLHETNDSSHNQTSESACQDCHSVHGANTLAGANFSEILWDWSVAGRGLTYSSQVLAVWPDPATLSQNDAQITAWCTGCHPLYVRTYEETLSVLYFDHVGSYSWETMVAKSHIMTTTAGGYGNLAANPEVIGTDVAYASSEYCRSCHDAGQTDQGPGTHSDSFPHTTPGYYKFVTVGESLVSSGSTNTTGTVDGLCLKCHRRDAATGAGIDF